MGQPVRLAQVLPKLTLPPSTPTLTADDKCPMCDGTGKAYAYDGSRLRWSWCDCERGQRLKVERYRQASELPPKFWEARLSDFAPEVQEQAERALTERRGLIIHGPVGCGKSHLAAACLNWLVGDDSDRFLYVVVPEMLERVRATYNSDKRDDLFDRALSMDWLVLDDLGTERITDWVRERQYMLINRRYNYRLATICTTNLVPSRLAAHIGDRAASRLMEMCEIVKLSGRDRRLARGIA